jgi:hypothetical protein
LSIHRDDLGAPLDPHDYPILTKLYTEGIGALLAYAMEEYGFESSRPTYATKCHLCYEIRRFIAVDCGIDSPELQPAGHYVNG